MTVNAVNRSAAVAPRRPAAPKPAAAPAAPAVRAKAQAPVAARPEKFSDLEAYKSFVLSSEASKLPAARGTVAAAEADLGRARQALAAKQREVNHDGLKATLDRAEAALEKATYPFRPQAEAKRSEAAQVTAQAGEIAKQIARAQQDIARAEGNKAARSRDFWWGDSKDYSGWDAAFDVIGAIGDASTISGAKKRIESAINKKVELEMKATTLIAEATALHNQKADAAAIAPQTKTRDEAKAAFDAAVALEAPEQKVVDAATSTLNGAKGELSRLEGVKKDLTDYSKQFGFVARVKLFFTDWAWKKDLDKFWTSKGL